MQKYNPQMYKHKYTNVKHTYRNTNSKTQIPETDGFSDRLLWKSEIMNEFSPPGQWPQKLDKGSICLMFILRYGTGFVGLAKNFWGEVTMSKSFLLSFRMWQYSRLTYSVTGGFKPSPILKMTVDRQQPVKHSYLKVES